MIQYKSFLPKAFAEKLYSLGTNVLYGTTNEKFNILTNKSWDENLVLNSAPVICINLDGDRLNMVQSILEEKGIYNQDKDYSLSETGSAMVYLWTKGSYIPVHNDGSYSKAATIYLNKEWSYNDGGMFNWYNKDEEKWNAVLPSFNLCLLNDKLQLHGTSPVTSENNVRITLQIFIELKKDIIRNGNQK